MYENHSTIRSEKLRQNLLAILGGRADLQNVVFQMNRLRFAESITTWLVSKGLVGNVFAEWYHEKFNYSFAMMTAHVAAEINKTRAPTMIYRGKSCLTN